MDGKTLSANVLCGDALELMRTMPDESFDLVVTSPPYNLLTSTGNGMKNPAGRWSNPELSNGYETHSDNMPHEQYAAWQRECLTEMMRLLTPAGAIFYNHKWRVQGGLLQDRHDIVGGFPVRQIIIWQRAGGINFNDGYFLPTYEVVYLIAKPDFKLASKANAFGDVWQINQESNNVHPAPFPLELPRRCVVSTDAQTVLDPFCGSGTTGVATKLLGRKFVGIDVSPSYCESARQRIADTKPENNKQMRLFD